MTTIRYLTYCSNCSNERLTPLIKLRPFDGQIAEESQSQINQIHLFGKTSVNAEKNTPLSNATIEFILATQRFNDALI